MVWEVKKGEGYTSPAIEGDVLVLFHALAGRETIECLHSETGQRYWTSDYEIDYRDRFGFANGPRGSPVIGEGRVVTLGVTSVLTCLDLKTGRVAWRRDLRKEFHVPQDFFGQGGTPLILDGKVIVNVGGKQGPATDNDSAERYAVLATPGLCVGAFDLKTKSCHSFLSFCRISSSASGFSASRCACKLPPSTMSVPRPAILVAIVTAPGRPACAMISASRSCCLAFKT
jgi:outer membrane protein assembly factor BamB